MMTNAPPVTADEVGHEIVRIPITVGSESETLEIAADRLISLDRPTTPPGIDAVWAVRDALESPHHYPSLRQALTPDDHVAVVVDEHLPRLAELLTVVLAHVTAAGVDPAAITLLCPPTGSRQAWIDDLPDAYQDVRLEIHNPADRNKLSYLASTKAGRRIYLSRSAVDADQLVVLTGPHFDPVLGYAGTEGAVYPILSDTETRARSAAAASLEVPGEHAWPVRKEAGEVSWLLGAPFYVQVIEGAGDEIVQVIGGSADSGADGRRWLDRCWKATVSRPADLVIATMSGDPSRQTIADLSRAMASAARVVREDGTIVVLSAAAREPGEGLRRVIGIEEPDDAYRALQESPPPDWPDVFLWLKAVGKAHVYLLSGLPPETAEGLFTTPLEHAGQVRRLIDAGGTCLVLPDAHKLMATVR